MWFGKNKTPRLHETPSNGRRSVSFDMRIDDASWIAKRLMVVETVTVGEVRPGIELQIQRSGQPIAVRVVGVEAYGKSLEVGQAGDRVGVLLDGVELNEVVLGLRLTGTRG